MSLPETPPETQAGTRSGLGAPDPTTPPSPAPVASLAVARSPVPAAFRLACPGCGTDVLFPYDAVLSAQLDQLLDLEEHLRELTCAREGVA